MMLRKITGGVNGRKATHPGDISRPLSPDLSTPKASQDTQEELEARDPVGLVRDLHASLRET